MNNCLACHEPMYEGEDYYACHNDECFLVDKEIKKYQWNSRPQHPLEELASEEEVDHYFCHISEDKPIKKIKQQFDSVADMLKAVEPEMAMEFLQSQNTDLKNELAELKGKVGEFRNRLNHIVYEYSPLEIIEEFVGIFNTEKEGV